MKLILLLLLLLVPGYSKNVDLDLDSDQSGWINLLDPFSSEIHDVRSIQECGNKEAIAECQKRIEQLLGENEMLKSKKSESVDVLLKHVLRQFFYKLNIDLIGDSEIVRFAKVRLSPTDIRTLAEYLRSERQSEEVALREKVRAALEEFITPEEQTMDNGFLARLLSALPYLIILNVVFLPLAILNVLRQVVGLRQFLIFFFLACFCVSYYFTYIRKYQEVLAERFSRIKHADDSCSPRGLVSEAFGVLLSYVRIKGKDKCLQKYEDMLVEPFLLVDPLRVFGEVLTNFLTSPLSVIGVPLSKFFNDFFIDTPIYLVAVKLIFIFLFFFYMSGYRFRSIFFTIEPTRAPVERAAAATISYLDTGMTTTGNDRQLLDNPADARYTQNEIQEGPERLGRGHRASSELRYRRTLSVGPSTNRN